MNYEKKQSNNSNINNQDHKYSETLLNVNRVTKVVKGGRNFSFSACIVLGNQDGVVGFAKGKASEVVDAKNKASAKAKKQTIKIPIYQKRTIHHDVVGQHGSTKILLRRAAEGKGVIAGPTVRSILFLAGLKDIVAKVHGSNNVYTTTRAVFNAFSKLCTPKSIAKKRDKDVSEISVISSTSESLKEENK